MKHILLILALAFSVQTGFAQNVYNSSGRPLNDKSADRSADKKKGFDKDRIIFGGWGVFGIGSGVTNLGITPTVGYRLTDEFAMGVGFGYQYLRIKDYFLVYDPNTFEQEYRTFNAHFYSPSIWARYLIWKNIFAHVEYEHNFTSYKEYENDYTQASAPIVTKTVDYNSPSLLVGGGFRQPVSDRSSFVIMGLYDVLQDKYSPYQGLVLRFGINFGY